MNKIFPGLIGLMLSLALSAQETGFSAQLCEQDADVCNALAVEIVRLELVNEIGQRRSNATSASLLCPNGERCCPEGSEALCQRHEAALIAEGQWATRAARQDDCPYAQSICDAIETSCDGDEIYLPWSGCTPRVTIEIPPYEPPPFCPDGTKWNGKICLPVPCYTQRLGIRIPCRAFEKQLTEAIAWRQAPGESDAERDHRLVALVKQASVREAAARQLREELESALRELEVITDDD